MPVFNTLKVFEVISALPGVRTAVVAATDDRDQTDAILVTVAATGTTFSVSGLDACGVFRERYGQLDADEAEVPSALVFDDAADELGGWSTDHLEDGMMYAHLCSYLRKEGFDVLPSTKNCY